MDYRIVRVEETRIFTEQVTTGSPQDGWRSRIWVTENAARLHAKVLSRNHPRFTYEIQNRDHEAIAVYKDGEEI